ncbi:hypothetical protein C8Q73DRAFT_837407 [Cubamyces lactineus]|nr:hypothetical protein C8Q73DRAFT_837407 [Cubamyces lactineus]
MECMANGRGSLRQDGGGFRNWDICRLILASLPAGDLLQMACVSKAISEEALRERLTRPILLNTYRQLSSLHRFVLSGDSASRRACVRNLTLALPIYVPKPPSNVWRDHLIQLLEGCRTLQYLDIQWYEQLILEDPRLPDVVASLTTLRCIDTRWIEGIETIPELDAALVNMFTTLQSTLDSLHLPSIPAGDTAVAFLRDLATLQTRLRVLSFSITRFIPLDVPFRSVTCLDLTLGNEYPRVRDIYRAFPNARDIRIDWETHINLLRPTEADALARRLAEQDCRANDVWRSLDVLSAPFEFLCVFTLTCPVRRLVLPNHQDGLWHWSDHAVELLSRLRPKQLDVVVDCRPSMGFPVPLDPRTFVNDSGSYSYKLEHLCARMWFNHSQRVPDTDEIIDKFRNVLSASQVKLFRLDLCDAVTVIDNQALNLGMSTGYQKKLAQCMTQIDILAIVRALVDCCPSLRIVVMNLDAGPDDRYWYVKKSEGRVEIEEVGPYSGKQMVAREEERL